MDEGFFMYGEEVEWCHRIGQAGWSILYFPGAEVLHDGGQSARQRPDSMTIALARSQLRVLAIIRGPHVAAAANLLMLVRDLPRALLWTLLALSPSLRQSPSATRLRAAAVRLPSHLRWVFQCDWSS
jgi:GT2 family glycosyltransferase